MSDIYLDQEIYLNLPRDFPDKANTISIGLPKPQNSARANTDASFANGAYGFQSIIVGTSSDDLEYPEHR